MISHKSWHQPSPEDPQDHSEKEQSQFEEYPVPQISGKPLEIPEDTEPPSYTETPEEPIVQLGNQEPEGSSDDDYNWENDLPKKFEFETEEAPANPKKASWMDSIPEPKDSEEEPQPVVIHDENQNGAPAPSVYKEEHTEEPTVDLNGINVEPPPLPEEIKSKEEEPEPLTFDEILAKIQKDTDNRKPTKKEIERNKPLFLRTQEEDARRLGKGYWALQGYVAFNAGVLYMNQIETLGPFMKIEDFRNTTIATAAITAVAFAGVHLMAKLKGNLDVSRIRKAVKNSTRMERSNIPESPVRGKILWPFIMAGAPLVAMQIAVKVHEAISTNTPSPLWKGALEMGTYTESAQRVFQAGMNLVNRSSNFNEQMLLTGTAAGLGIGIAAAMRLTNHSRMHGIIGITRHWARAVVKRNKPHDTPQHLFKENMKPTTDTPTI